MTEPQTSDSPQGRTRRRLIIAAVVTVLCLLPFALAALGVPLPLAAVSSELKAWPADEAARSELKPWPVADSELKPWPAAEAELKQFPTGKAAAPVAPARPASR